MRITQLNNSIKYCIKCGCKLFLGTNFTKGIYKFKSYICKYCQKKKNNKWTKNNRERRKVASKNSCINWRNNNPEKYRNQNIKSKANRRKLGNTELFNNLFSKNIPVVGHHISDAFIVYIPAKLHLKHLHGKYTKLHREELKPYVESIYNFSYLIEDLIVCQDVNNKKKGV